jgi:hypothetical protein
MDFRYFLAPPWCCTIRSKGPEPAVLEHFLSTVSSRLDSADFLENESRERVAVFLSDKEI